LLGGEEIMAEISEDAKETLRDSGYNESEVGAYQQASDTVFEEKRPVLLVLDKDGKWVEKPLR